MESRTSELGLTGSHPNLQAIQQLPADACPHMLGVSARCGGGITREYEEMAKAGWRVDFSEQDFWLSKGLLMACA